MSFSWETCGSWLLQSAAAGGALLLLTQGLARFVRQPARRQRLCEYGVLAAVLAAVLSLLLPGWLLVPHAGGGPLARGVSAPVGMTLDPLPPEPGPTRAAHPALPAPGGVIETAKKPAVEVEPMEAVDDIAPSVGARALEWSQAWVLPGLTVVQALGAGLFLGYLLVGHVALSRLLAKARPAPPDVVELFLPMLAGRRAPRLLVSEQVRVPLSCGLARPTVVIPATLCAPANARKLRWIFAHELTHLRRRDAWSSLLFCVGQALYFYVPWFWWLRRQARLCQEFVADAVAALEEVPPVSYAEFLVSLTNAPAVPMAATGVAGQSSDLFRRVSMLLQNPLSVERDCPRRWSLLAAGSLLALAVVLSGVSLTAQPARAQEKDVIIRRAQGEPIKITIYIEGGDKKEPVIRKDEKVKVLVVPDGKGGKKEERILYWTPRVIIEKKGDAKAAPKERAFRYWIEQFKGDEKEKPQEPVRKSKVILEKETPGEKPSPKKETRYRILTAPQDIHFWTDGKIKPDIQLWDGKALIQWHKKADVNLEKLRKALEKLEKIPNVDADQIRREVMKALEQLEKVKPLLDGKWHFEYRLAPEKEKGTEEKKLIERKQSEKKPPAPKVLYEFVPQEKAREEAAKALIQLGDRVRATEVLGRVRNRMETPRRLGVEIDLPGAILADQLNLPKGQGVVVQRVAPKSAAEKAGLRVGDVILEINQQTVPADLGRFPRIIQELPGGQALDVIVIRKGRRQTISGVRLSADAPTRTGDDAKAAVEKGVGFLQLHKTGNEQTATAHALATLLENRRQQEKSKDGAMTTTVRKGERFTTKHQEGTLVITVAGEVNNQDGLEITIQEGAVTHRYNRVDRVPAAYRDKVSQLIEVSGKVASRLPR
jgi:beta-lactamase regulating signal transducer with metallopeptidase domain